MQGFQLLPRKRKKHYMQFPGTHLAIGMDDAQTTRETELIEGEFAMNTRLISLRAVLALAISATSGFAIAQEKTIIQPQTAPSGIEYVSGGIGDRQQEAMKVMRKDYNLRLTFARPGSGEYLADVRVTIENADNAKVLDITSPGPLLFAKLPPGAYRIAAEFEGQRQVKKVTIQDGHPRGLVYRFAKK